MAKKKTKKKTVRKDPKFNFDVVVAINPKDLKTRVE